MSPRLALLALTIAITGAVACKPPEPAQQDGQAGGANLADSTLLTTADAARIQGDSAAPIWLMEISDFQCPFCARWHEETYPVILEEYVKPGKVRMAYINLPLSSHVHAEPAAEAAMCAGVQGKFWPVHDGIFRTQERWSGLTNAQPVFDSIAGAAGVVMAAYRDCVTNRRTAPMVGADASRAREIGVQSTPSFLILRGQEVIRGIAGAYPADTFRVVLDAALAGRPQP